PLKLPLNKAPLVKRKILKVARLPPTTFSQPLHHNLSGLLLNPNGKNTRLPSLPLRFLEKNQKKSNMLLIYSKNYLNWFLLLICLSMEQPTLVPPSYLLYQP